ncbi:MAG: aminoacyl-tRNA hydrolase [Fimbriimonadales bacterium]
MFRRKPKEPTLPPEWMIVGLGNPGREYQGTRHNVGFEVVDRLAHSFDIAVRASKHNALYGAGVIEGVPVVLVKPLTFMNLSGRAVAAFMRSYNLKPERILVVADDLDLDVGRVRLKPKGSHGGHNGHRSLIESLGSSEYPRIKIGIGEGGEETIDHVLSRFSAGERKLIDDAVKHAAEGCVEIVRDGTERAMSFVNDPERRP